MRELIERIAKVMPKSDVGIWHLEPKRDGWWLWLDTADPCVWDFDHTMYESDLALYPELILAPLTALLKQELPVCRTERYDDYPENCRWACEYQVRCESGGATEFEAVASAYLSLRPKEEA